MLTWLAPSGSRYNSSHFGSEALLYVLIGEGAGMALMSHSGAVRNLPLTISTCENSCDFARRFVIENSERLVFALSGIHHILYKTNYEKVWLSHILIQHLLLVLPCKL